jgi:hypothetical protein
MLRKFPTTVACCAPPGDRGEDGRRGSQGYAGNLGAQGYQGSAGRQGTAGVVGDAGLQGFQGTAGFGPQGEAGSEGERGILGEAGLRGAQGFVGRQGAQGGFGAQGRDGSRGGQGPRGFQGDAGGRGQGGSAGLQGSQGYVGAQGTRGRPGVQGFSGEAGRQGNQGTAGSRGFQGDDGARGAQGGSVRGVQGYQGCQGDRGLQGAPGDPIAVGGSVIRFSHGLTVINTTDNPFLTVGFGSRNFGPFTGGANINANDPAIGRAYYFRVPRSGLLRNMYASVQYRSATSVLPAPSGYLWQINLWRAPAPAGNTSLPVFQSTPSLTLAFVQTYDAGGAFLSDVNTTSAVPVNAGDYITLSMGVFQIPNIAPFTTINTVTFEGGIELA